MSLALSMISLDFTPMKKMLRSLKEARAPRNLRCIKRVVCLTWYLIAVRKKTMVAEWSGDDSDADDFRGRKKESAPITPSCGGSEGGADFMESDRKKDKKDKKVEGFHSCARMFDEVAK